MSKTSTYCHSAAPPPHPCPAGLSLDPSRRLRAPRASSICPYQSRYLISTATAPEVAELAAATNCGRYRLTTDGLTRHSARASIDRTVACCSDQRSTGEPVPGMRRPALPGHRTAGSRPPPARCLFPCHQLFGPRPQAAWQWTSPGHHSHASTGHHPQMHLGTSAGRQAAAHCRCRRRMPEPAPLKQSSRFQVDDRLRCCFRLHTHHAGNQRR